MKAIHQLVAGFAVNDAISNEARVLRTLFRSWGYASDIFSEPHCISPILRKEARDVTQLVSTIRPDDLAVKYKISIMTRCVF